MIDPMSEDLLTPKEATRYFPRGPSGRYPHVAKIYRLVKEGKLEHILTPKLATSRQAIARMFTRFTEGDRPAEPTIHTRAVQKQTSREVEQELDRLGI